MENLIPQIFVDGVMQTAVTSTARKLNNKDKDDDEMSVGTGVGTTTTPGTFTTVSGGDRKKLCRETGACGGGNRLGNKLKKKSKKKKAKSTVVVNENLSNGTTKVDSNSVVGDIGSGSKRGFSHRGSSSSNSAGARGLGIAPRKGKVRASKPEPSSMKSIMTQYEMKSAAPCMSKEGIEASSKCIALYIYHVW